MSQISNALLCSGGVLRWDAGSREVSVKLLRILGGLHFAARSNKCVQGKWVINDLLDNLLPCLLCAARRCAG